ncbi:MAG: hypothetical protein R2852_07170 [Bacteroidia bacterium]
MDVIDTHILNFSEENRYKYLTLCEFILSCHPEIQVQKKYGIPFFINKGNLIYIGHNSKLNEFYLGFMHGQILNREFTIISLSDTKLVGKWYYNSDEQFEKDKNKLRSSVLRSIELNSTKKQHAETRE